MYPELKRRLLVIHIPSAVLSALIAIYVFVQVVFFAAAGQYTYQTRTNLGHPVNLSIKEDPVLFIGLCFIQLAIGAFAAGWCWESSYDAVRLLKPSLGLPRVFQGRPFRPALWLLGGGSLLVLIGLVQITAKMQGWFS